MNADQRHKIVLDPGSEKGYRLEPAAPSAAEPTLRDFRAMTYEQRAELHTRNAEVYRRLAEAELAETFQPYRGR
ncbi:hypothetical protein [Haloechinothrix halophila]|uniref:Uncharacterized protein n=1 Tax=Haloechinothrix halophila YIM 93223 TaxID=592678 RepID=W9DN84_9PSEU|nr:hypothetical protein [Haloechinothrix halophila]ETA66368.1 hypothetical protein AmyhaDRAFT_0122 [Haloechinothrix halophila YIM 93223]